MRSSCVGPRGLGVLWQAVILARHGGAVTKRLTNSARITHVDIKEGSLAAVFGQFLQHHCPDKVYPVVCAGFGARTR